MATRVPDSHGVYMVPAFVGLGAPHWDPDARGAIFGLTLGATGAHLARAALEAVAYQSLDLIGGDDGRLRDQPGGNPRRRRNGRQRWLCQFLADILQVPVERPTHLETTALGAAFHAGLATGVWAGLAGLPDAGSQSVRFEPKMASADRERLVAGWKAAVARTIR